MTYKATDPDRLARIERAARRLWKRVPKPWKPRPKPQASWQQLKPGQWLRALGPTLVGSRHLPSGSLWEVIKTDSQGATLECRSESQPTVTVRLADKAWKGQVYERARKPRARARGAK